MAGLRGHYRLRAARAAPSISIPQAPGGSGKAFAERAVAEEKLIVVPGSVFGAADTHFRIAYTVSDRHARPRHRRPASARRHVMIERRERNAMPPRTAADVAKALDHAVLKPEYSRGRPREACRDVRGPRRGLPVRAVGDVAAAARLVAGSPVVVASVIGFPHGAPAAGGEGAGVAARDRRRGPRTRHGDERRRPASRATRRRVRDDIAAVVAEAKPRGVLVKVILETCYLTPAEIATACRLAESAGADFVKTSTGFGVKAGGPTGATPEAVRVMLDTVGGRLQVKASGGIRTWDDAVGYLDMGCTRLGVGDAAAILDGGPARGDASY